MKAEEDGDNDFKVVGSFVKDIGFDSLTSGLFNFGIQTAGHLAAWEIAKNGRKMTNSAKLLIRVDQTIKIRKRVYKVCDENLEKIEGTLYFYHGLHKEKRNSYDSDYPYLPRNCLKLIIW